jgi:hypothetical protein
MVSGESGLGKTDNGEAKGLAKGSGHRNNTPGLLLAWESSRMGIRNSFSFSSCDVQLTSTSATPSLRSPPLQQMLLLLVFFQI